ncbi:MAG: hypothetical protein QOE53_3204 [Pseudonocardiales bacterium]|jgi:hypothetical protein|nr:hypothetical protein [Pseudonocardiales bacterium]
MPSPFISVSRRRKRSAPSRSTLVGVVAVVALLGMVVPALGGPKAFSAASPLSIAKKALKTAKKANKKSTKALLRASRGVPNESITSAKIANLTIKSEDLSAGAVGSGKIANGAIQNQDIGDGQITFNKIANGTIGTDKIGDGQIHNEDIAPGAVGSGKIANGSVTTADLAGADIHGSIAATAGFVPAHSCVTTAVDLIGAKAGDVALLTFTGGTQAPPGLTFQILKVGTNDHGTLRYCNPTGAASDAFSNVGVRVLTFH